MRSLFLMEFEVLLFTTCLQELEQGLSSVTPGGPSGTQRRIWLLFSSHKEKVNALSQGTQPSPPTSPPVPGWGRCGTVPSAARPSTRVAALDQLQENASVHPPTPNSFFLSRKWGGKHEPVSGG